MTSFDLQSAFTPEDWPDYTQPEVNITTELIVHANGTVTVVYRNVPWLDLDDLLTQQGELEGRTQMLEALGEAITRKGQELFPSMFGAVDAGE